MSEQISKFSKSIKDLPIEERKAAGLKLKEMKANQVKSVPKIPAKTETLIWSTDSMKMYQDKLVISYPGRDGFIVTFEITGQNLKVKQG